MRSTIVYTERVGARAYIYIYVVSKLYLQYDIYLKSIVGDSFSDENVNRRHELDENITIKSLLVNEDMKGVPSTYPIRPLTSQIQRHQDFIFIAVCCQIK